MHLTVPTHRNKRTRSPRVQPNKIQLHKIKLMYKILLVSAPAAFILCLPLQTALFECRVSVTHS